MYEGTRLSERALHLQPQLNLTSHTWLTTQRQVHKVADVAVKFTSHGVFVSHHGDTRLEPRAGAVEVMQ